MAQPPGKMPPAAVTAAPSDYDAGAEVRRQVKLHALRAELQALLEILQAPLGNAARRPAAQATATPPMRPRLVLEPRPPSPRPEPARGESLRLVASAQREPSPLE